MLELLERILSKFDDDIPLVNLKPEDTPAYALYQCYLEIQGEDGAIEALPSEATTGDLKQAIQALTHEQQAALLDKHLIYSPDCDCDETKAGGVIDKIWNDAPLRRWLVKATVSFVFFIVTLAVGIGYATAYFTGNISDGVFTNTVMNTGLEIFKLIFIAK